MNDSLIVTVSFNRRLFFSFFLALNCLVSTLPIYSKVFFLEADLYQDKTQIKKIVLGRGEIISSDNVISRAALSDPSIADLKVLDGKQIFITAKQLGTSTVLIWEKDKTIPARFEVSVWPDIQQLKGQLQELDENIVVDYIPPTNSSSSNSGEGTDPGLGGGGSGGELGDLLGALGGGLGGSAEGEEGGAPGGGSEATSGKVILKGKVENAEIIARALQIAGAYVGDQGIKIVSQPGGQIVDGLAGEYDINSNSDAEDDEQGSGAATAFGARDPIRFTSNRYANLSRGVIATTKNGAVISFLKVKHQSQIAVAIRFYEISRNLSKNLGLNGILGGSTLQGGSFVGGNGVSQVTGGIGSIANLSEFMAATGESPASFSFTRASIAGGSFLSQTIKDGVTGVIFNPDNGIGAIIQALQERGEIKTLAEPNLVIANGEPASFLAGGEVPIVRSVFTAGGSSQDVTYEPFGIKFSLLPTITSKDKIYLQLVPEIRDIDSELSDIIAPPGSTTIRPPAFRTRRTQTQVELYSGQAFAISGLLREDNTRNLRKVPGIADIPILGSLFRSKSFNKGETELLIVVSPQVVEPVNPEEIAELKKSPPQYNDLNQFPPLKPDFKKQYPKNEEQGPDDTPPIDADKYNRPYKKSLNDIEENNKHVQEVSNSNARIKKFLDRFSKSEEELQEERAKALKKEEKKRLKEAKKKEKLAKKEEEKRLKKLKLINQQKELEEKLEQEQKRFSEAREAMKNARQSLSSN